jgi:hypothetical protein
VLTMVLPLFETNAQKLCSDDRAKKLKNEKDL